jgi:hypothetical protein
MKHCHPALLTTALLAATSAAAPLCHGQVLPLIYLVNQARSGTDPDFRSGSYQLTDGTWKEGKWVIHYDRVAIIGAGKEAKKQGQREFSTDEVQRFVAGKDTFGIIRNFDIPEPAEHITAGFAQQLYRGGEFSLNHYVYFRPNTVASKSYKVLYRGADTPVIVPAKPREFREFMLKYVGDHPLLAKQLTKSTLELKDAPQILESYVNWKRYQSAPAGK